MAIADVSILPVGTGSPSVSQYVVGAVSVLLKEKGLIQQTEAGLYYKEGTQ